MLSIFKLFLPQLLQAIVKSKNKLLIFLTAVMIVISSTIFLMLRKKDIQENNLHKKENTIDVLIRSNKVDEILKKQLQILKPQGCTALALFQYHNGIFLKSGNPLLKSTITNLVVTEVWKEVWDISSLQAVSLTVFGKDFLKLVKNKIYVFNKDDEDISYSVKSRLYFTKSESVVSVIIENKEKEPIGNLSIYFNQKINEVNQKQLAELSESVSFELVGKL